MQFGRIGIKSIAFAADSYGVSLVSLKLYDKIIVPIGADDQGVPWRKCIVGGVGFLEIDQTAVGQIYSVDHKGNQREDPQADQHDKCIETGYFFLVGQNLQSAQKQEQKRNEHQQEGGDIGQPMGKPHINGTEILKDTDVRK